MNQSFKQIGFLLIAIGLLSSSSYNFNFSLKTPSAIASTIFKIKLPPPPPNRGIAGNRVGGASRIASKDPTIEGTNSDRHLTAIVPEYRNSKTSPPQIWGLTTKERPTLYFYIPYSQDAIDRIDFILIDRDRPATKIVYQNAIQSPERPGIVNFSLPQTNAPLAVDKLYQWELKLTMKRQIETEISVKGWIQRVGLNNESIDLIDRSNPHKQAALYAENGFWYDALSSLAELRQNTSQDPTIVQSWKNMLKSVDLGKLANKPFVR